jgi:hypothetical protein
MALLAYKCELIYNLRGSGCQVPLKCLAAAVYGFIKLYF